VTTSHIGYGGERAPEPEAQGAAPHPLASVHTDSFTEALTKAGISLAISTYQAGKVIIARAENGGVNTHFRSFDKPMGMVATGDRLTIGSGHQIHDYRNCPGVAPKLPPSGSHDAVYLQRSVHTTGDIDIHEMVWQGNDLFFVNTRFSCLCRFDPRYTFDPVWKPDFITGYDARDRCHLNGVGSRDGKVRYVSALATTDEPGGWRQQKTSGGFILDLETNTTLASGLAMPHSPRWHKNALWFLESGNGSLCKLVPGEPSREIVRLPGFTRGLDFYRNLAFIGVSQVRETAVFSGIEVTKSQAVRDSGVWVVDLNTERVVAFLKFTAGIQEVFSVCVLPSRFPDVLPGDDPLTQQTYVLRDELLPLVVEPDASWQPTEALFEAGNEDYNAGRIAAACEKYHQALSVDPGFLPARFNLAIALSEQQDFVAARHELEFIVAQEAGHVEALNSLGYVASQLQEYAAARRYFERALAIRPQFQLAQDNLERLRQQGH